MSQENRNLFLTIIISIAILFGWNYVFPTPEAPPAPPQQQTQVTQQNTATPQAQATKVLETRDTVLDQSPRVKIDTPSIEGSISLKGGRIDDVKLKNYRETVDPSSPIITLMTPKGAANAYQAEFNWLGTDASQLPNSDTLWTTSSTALTPTQPLVLTWDNGKGLVFTRTISVDDKALFTVADSVKNNSEAAIDLTPYGIIARYGKPQVAGYAVLHEGMIGILGDNGLQEYTYDAVAKEAAGANYDHGKEWANLKGGYVGFSDKYWATALIPDQSQTYRGSFTQRADPTVGNVYQAAVVGTTRSLAAGATTENTQHFFAGAKEASVLDAYQTQLKVDRFDRLIDWGWFFFITRPLFKVIDFLYKFVGNFGVSILVITLLIKLIFLPLANKSYASMAKMKAVQPEMTAIRERYADDKTKQQQALMELYKKEKINPVSGCWPMLVQIPVFFALYKVLFVSIEMRHAPFIGWIKDLAAPDPTTIFNLFGLIPFDPSTFPVIGSFLMLGAWPVIMGLTMWIQMKMNPQAADPTQQMIFAWMPLIFTFMLAHFPAGLVIYWAWNNTLSVIQQYFIMKRHGVKVELWDNLKNVFKRKAA
ncbi:membrane protein insertase YidC [Microvirga sp. W0021]|uniref:Membrane protein insertase YidC n=1 Tax=Hohaiivirga grylli TaxID=3133970 RepID=A0ABV0BNJ8_9HYPH